MAKKVKAAVVPGPGRIEIREFPYPKVAEEAALVRMEMSGICGSDLHMYKGEGVCPTRETPFPIIIGHENVGTIVEIGSKAAECLDVEGSPLRKGDRIVHSPDVPCGECDWCKAGYEPEFCTNMTGYGTVISCKDYPHLFGGCAEYMYILPGTFVYKVPEDLPTDVAVLTEPMAVAYGSMLKAMQPYPMIREGFSAGDTVVVVGPGPLGMCHASMAMMMGAGKVMMTGSGSARDAKRLEIAKEIGIDNVVNSPDSQERIDEILELTGNKGSDLVIECAGVPQAFREALEMVKKGGTVLEVGNFIDTGGLEISPWKHICAPMVHIIGSWGFPNRRWNNVLRLLQKYPKAIPFEKIVTDRFSVDETEKAIKTAMTQGLKVVVSPELP